MTRHGKIIALCVGLAGAASCVMPFAAWSQQAETTASRRAGVIDIDPKAVVSSQPAAKYEVLPQQAGLVQLIASGALQQNRSGEYILRNKIRFPAGLYGAHSVTFLIMKSSPYPDGDPGHSCVIMEESGEKKGSYR